MQRFTLTLFAIILSSPLALGALPSWLKTCKSSDPDYEKCKLESAKAAIPKIVQGDRAYGIPKLNPLTLPFISLQAGDLTLNFTDLIVHGLENSKATKVNYDFDKNVLDIDLEVPKLELKGPYKVSGKVLILSIEGEGPGQIVLHDGVYNAKIFLKEIKKDGKTFVDPIEVELVISMKKATFALENLFNGDKKLGPEMNTFLNENWEVVINDFKGSFESIVGEVFKAASKGIVTSVPLDEIFPK